MFTRAFFTTLMVALLAVGCASNKPKNSQDGSNDGANGANNGLSLELNGDSDSNKAGGLQTVFFAFDSSALDASAKNTMQANADFLKSNAKVDIQVEGHCDERGTDDYNQALGQRRANVVRDWFTSNGVPATRLNTVSFGEQQPAARGSNENTWRQNRRAETSWR
jgi:peptidoglycan-associated lipoprotein